MKELIKKIEAKKNEFRELKKEFGPIFNKIESKIVEKFKLDPKNVNAEFGETDDYSDRQVIILTFYEDDKDRLYCWYSLEYWLDNSEIFKKSGWSGRSKLTDDLDQFMLNFLNGENEK